MTDLNKQLAEKKTILTQKQEDRTELINSFLDTLFPEKEFNIEFDTVIAKRTISLNVLTKLNNFQVKLNYDKNNNTHSNSYYMEEIFASDDKMKELSDIIIYLQSKLVNVTTDQISEYIKNYTAIDQAVKRNQNKIRELRSDIKKNGNQNYLTAIKSFLCSEKDIIQQDKKDFVDKEEHSKKLVYFKLNDFSEKKLCFTQGELTVRIQSGKRRFEFAGKLISKKEAMEILDQQIFKDKKQVLSFRNTPFYVEPSIRSQYSSYRKSWSIELNEYITKVKGLLMQLKLIEF